MQSFYKFSSINCDISITSLNFVGNNESLVEKLIKHGADVNAADNDRRTAIHLVAATGNA